MLSTADLVFKVDAFITQNRNQSLQAQEYLPVVLIHGDTSLL